MRGVEHRARKTDGSRLLFDQKIRPKVSRAHQLRNNLESLWTLVFLREQNQNLRFKVWGESELLSMTIGHQLRFLLNINFVLSLYSISSLKFCTVNKKITLVLWKHRINLLLQIFRSISIISIVVAMILRIRAYGS